MKSVPRFSMRLAGACASLLLCGVTAEPAFGQTGLPDAQAIARALGFLQTLPTDGVMVIGIVYAPAVLDGRTTATQIADRFREAPGPNGGTFRAEIVAINGLAAFENRLDALFLLPEVFTQNAMISEFVSRRKLVSISSDPACVDANCCVLMVRTGQSVEIVLNTRLADAAGIRFSSIFTMMVERR